VTDTANEMGPSDFALSVELGPELQTKVDQIFDRLAQDPDFLEALEADTATALSEYDLPESFVPYLLIDLSARPSLDEEEDDTAAYWTWIPVATIRVCIPVGNLTVQSAIRSCLCRPIKTIRKCRR
jgi:hypothetical protein